MDAKNIIQWIIDLSVWWYQFPFLFIAKWCIRNNTRGITDSVTCLVGKTAIVTGGNSGIGYATSVLLASRGCKVIIACRSDAEKERKAIIEQTDNPNIVVKKLDLARLSSVRAFAEDIKRKESKIDILINNAGIGASSQRTTENGLNTVMQVNYFGHVLLTYLLLDQLKAADSARVVFLSSGTAFFRGLRLEKLDNTDNDINPFLLYSNSKLCNIIAAQELAKKLRQFRIIVNSADPGVVTTPIFERSYSVIKKEGIEKKMLQKAQMLFSTDIYIGAQTTFHLATSKNVRSGDLYFRCKPFSKPPLLNDTKFCEKVLLKTEKILDLSFDVNES